MICSIIDQLMIYMITLLDTDYYYYPPVSLVDIALEHPVSLQTVCVTATTSFPACCSLTVNRLFLMGCS